MHSCFLLSSEASFFQVLSHMPISFLILLVLLILIPPIITFWLGCRRRSSSTFSTDFDKFRQLNISNESLLLLDQLPIYIYAEDIDNEYRHILVNKVCEKLWGLPREEVLGKSDFELFTKSKEIEEFRRTDIEASHSDSIHRAILPVTGANGQTRICDFVRKRLDLPGNRHILLGLAIDITEKQSLLENHVALNECFKAILENSIKKDSILMLMKALCQRLKAEQCFLLEYDFLHNEIILDNCYHNGNAQSDNHHIGARIAVSFSDPVFKQQELNVLSNDAAFPKEVLAQLSDWNNPENPKHDFCLYASGISFNQKPWGSFCVIFDSPDRHLSAPETVFCQSCAHIFSIMLDRIKEQQQLLSAKETNEIWELISNSISFPIFVKDMTDQGKYVTCNNQLAAITGNSRESLIGKNDFDFFPLEQAQHLRQNDLEVILQSEIIENEEELTEPETGELHYYLSSKRPYVSSKGHQLLLCAVSDVTELRNIARCEMAGSQALIETVNEPDFRKALSKLAEAIELNMYADRTSLVQLTHDGRFRLFEEWSSNSGKLCSENIVYFEQAWNLKLTWLKDGNSVFCEDALHDPEFKELRQHIHGYNTRSWLAEPIFVREQFWGFINFDFVKKAKKFSRNDKSMARLMANIVATAILRHELSTALVTSENQNRVILDNIYIPIWLFDGKGELIRANHEVGKIFGIDPMNLTTLKNRELITNSYVNGIETPIDKVLKTNRPVHEEHKWNGRLYRIAAEPVFNQDGSLNNIVKSAVDVTELNSLIEYQKIINFCFETFFQESDFETAFSQVLKHICAYMKATLVLVLRFDPEKNQAIPYFEYSDGRNKFLPKPLNYSPDEQWIQTFLNRRQLLMSDVTTPENRAILGSWDPLFEANNVQSIYFSELFFEDQLFGDFGFMYCDHSHQISEYEKRFLTTIGRMLEMLLLRERNRINLLDALESVRRSDATKNILLANEQMLNQGMNAVLGSQQPMDAMHTVLSLLRDRLNCSRFYLIKADLTRQVFIPVHEVYASDRGVALDFTEVSFPQCPKENLFPEKVITIEDILDERNIGKYSLWQDKNNQHSVRSIAQGTLRLNGNIWGKVGLTYEGKKHLFTVEEKEFLNNAFHLIELVIQRTDGQERLIAAKDQAQSAARAKSMFLASMSHEIRTPLNAVIGFSELLKVGNISEKLSNEYLDGISRSGNALLALINDVLDLSKLEAGQMTFINTELDFNELLQEMKSVFRQKCQAQGLNFIINIADSIPLLIADKLRLRQILFNLIGNAVKFTQAGSIRITASFLPKTEQTGDFSFVVSDTGIGISQDDQKKLFQLFMQIQPSGGRGVSFQEGTGLGLALVRRLVEGMHGKISLTSEVGKGSHFTVELNNVAYKKANYATLELTPHRKSVAPVINCSLLLVDDIELNIRVLSAMLERLGIKPVTTNYPSKALEILQKQSFDIILTDLWMPDLNGEELVRKIRGMKNFNNAKIVAITADVDSASSFDLSVFDEVISKPVSFSQIKQTLLSLLANSLNGNSKPNKNNRKTNDAVAQDKYLEKTTKEEDNDCTVAPLYSALVVEDVELNLRSLMTLLTQCGISPMPANHPQKALEMLKDNSFDFIFTDMWMPDMNGSSFAKRVRQSEHYHGEKIVVITDEDNNRMHCDFSVFDELVLKPVSLDKINDVVNKLKAALQLTSKESEPLSSIQEVELSSEKSNTHKASAPKLQAAKLTRSALVVDDVTLNLKVIAAMLEMCGVAPTKADHPQKALNILQEKSFDYIFTDLWMPGMNGVQFIQRARKMERFNNTKVVALTADYDNEVHNDMSVFDEVVTKPISLDKIKTVLSMLED